MAGLYKKYSDQGFHIVALEHQNSTPEQIASLAKTKKVPYQLCEGGNLDGASGGGIPQTYLIGPDGKFVARDLPGKALEDKIKLLIKDASVVYPGPGPFKKLAPMVAQIKTGRSLGSLLKQFAAKQTSKDADEAAEAKMVYETVHASGQESLDSALADKESDPCTAIFRLDNLALRYDGVDIAATAKKESDALKKDPKIKKEMDGENMWQRIVAFQDQLKPIAGNKDPKNEAFRKANIQGIQILMGGVASLMQQFPDTVAAKKADQLAAEYR